MDTIKRLILLHVPLKKCNLSCQYCYITANKNWDRAEDEQYFLDVDRLCNS